MKIQYDFSFSFERLGRTHENKNIFFFVLTKTGYFNTEVVFLRYKKYKLILIKIQ